MTQQECAGLQSRLSLETDIRSKQELAYLVSGHQKEIGAGAMKILLLLQFFFLLHFGSLVQAKTRHGNGNGQDDEQ